jgi:hypothetical protein
LRLTLLNPTSSHPFQVATFPLEDKQMISFFLLSCRLRQFAKLCVGVLLPTLAFTQVPPASRDRISRVSQGDVIADVKVVTPPTARIDSIDRQTARVELEAVTVRRGDYVVSLLANKGVRQDTEALALIYDLNPQIEDIRQIQAGQKLILPSIEGSRSLEHALRTGYRVELLRNLAEAQGVKVKADEFQQLETTVDRLAIDRFDSPGVKTEVTNALSETRKALDAIKSSDHIVSKKVLKQANADAGFILKTLMAMVGSGRILSGLDVDQIKESAENLQAVGQEVTSGGSGLVLTQINTKSVSTGDPVRELTVFYAPKADRGAKTECSQLSTPLTEAIARGHYVFWAMRGSDKVSDDKERTIRKDTRNIPLDIPVIR